MRFKSAIQSLYDSFAGSFDDQLGFEINEENLSHNDECCLELYCEGVEDV